MQKVYWFITVMQKIKNDSKSWIYCGDMRTWGFYSNREDALEALHTNATDMYETIYDYALLEPYYEGLCGYVYEIPRQFFKYDKEKDGYFEIPTPHEADHVISFAIG